MVWKIRREEEPNLFIEKIKSQVKASEVIAKPKLELPRSIDAKVQQINFLVDEFGTEGNRLHWLEILNQGLGILGGELLPYIGVIDEKLAFKEQPSQDKEEEFVQALRTIIDFLVKKAVEEVGSSQARAKVQIVIERMRQV